MPAPTQSSTVFFSTHRQNQEDHIARFSQSGWRFLTIVLVAEPYVKTEALFQVFYLIYPSKIVYLSKLVRTKAFDAACIPYLLK